MLESEISPNGLITFPKAVWEALALEPGDRVRYVIQGGEERIIKVRPIDRLYGVLRHKGPPATLEDMERAISEGACDT